MFKINAIILIRLIPFLWFAFAFHSYTNNGAWEFQTVGGLWFLFGMLFADLLRNGRSIREEANVSRYFMKIAFWPGIKYF